MRKIVGLLLLAGLVVGGSAEAKKNKDFARADEIRNQLTARGVIIIDTPNGPTWKRG